MKDRSEISVQRQATFGADGSVETTDEPAETDLQQWGIVEAEPERETKVEPEAASEFGVDDRQETKQSQSAQSSLFESDDDQQQTLGGGRASNISRWDR
jgi:hypothetical protein